MTESINIPFIQLEERLSEIPKNKKIVVYCNSGGTGSKAQILLLNNHFSVSVDSINFQNKKYKKTST
ncbi:rhodanese-like domain-containing protein [uncultured Cetobacterium sp.]|uniref:rhodanese-like domain-containing protein n=1 Tax=uncultured Cetobacterium sp. TaxID=527638 RepID=UPI0034585965